MIYKFLGERRFKKIEFLTSAALGGEVCLLLFIPRARAQGKASYLGHEIWSRRGRKRR